MISRIPPQAEKAPVSGLRNSEPQVESFAVPVLVMLRRKRLSKPPIPPINNKTELVGKVKPSAIMNNKAQPTSQISLLCQVSKLK